MARLPTKEEIEVLFNAIDTDGNGLICVDELYQVLGTKNFRRDEIETIVTTLDKDGDGKINRTAKSNKPKSDLKLAT